VIGLDANILVRYLTRDDPGQFAKAAALIETAADRDEPLLIGTAVLCELTWVLDSVYEYSRNDIALTLDRILATAQFEVDRHDEVRQALTDFRASKADFSDALIGRLHRSLGASHTATFDRGLKALDTFKVL
jgi:predicted nucleic-acid-binding protein